MLVAKFHTEQRSANSKGSAREDAATEALFLHWKFGMRPYLFVLQFHTDVLDMSHRKRRCMLGISWNRSSTSKFKETKYVSRSKLYPTLYQGTRRAWSWWRGWEVSSVRADRRNLLLHSPSFTFIHLHLSSQAGSHSTDMESEGNALSGSAISVVLPEINKGRERPGWNEDEQIDNVLKDWQDLAICMVTAQVMTGRHVLRATCSLTSSTSSERHVATCSVRRSRSIRFSAVPRRRTQNRSCKGLGRRERSLKKNHTCCIMLQFKPV